MIILSEEQELEKLLEDTNKLIFRNNPNAKESEYIKEYKPMLESYHDRLVKDIEKNRFDMIMKGYKHKYSEDTNTKAKRSITESEKKILQEEAKLLLFQFKYRKKIKEMENQIGDILSTKNTSITSIDMEKINANKKDIINFETQIEEQLNTIEKKIKNLVKEFKKLGGNDNSVVQGHWALLHSLEEGIEELKTKSNNIIKDLETKFKGPYRIQDGKITIKGQEIQIRQLGDHYQISNDLQKLREGLINSSKMFYLERTELIKGLDQSIKGTEARSIQSEIRQLITDRIKNYELKDQSHGTGVAEGDFIQVDIYKKWTPPMHKYNDEQSNNYMIELAKNVIEKEATNTFEKLIEYKQAIEKLQDTSLSARQKNKEIKKIQKMEKVLLQQLNGVLNMIEISDITNPESIVGYEQQALLPRLSPDSPEAKAYSDLFDILYSGVTSEIKLGQENIKSQLDKIEKERQKQKEKLLGLFKELWSKIKTFFAKFIGNEEDIEFIDEGKNVNIGTASEDLNEKNKAETLVDVARKRDKGINKADSSGNVTRKKDTLKRGKGINKADALGNVTRKIHESKDKDIYRISNKHGGECAIVVGNGEARYIPQGDITFYVYPTINAADQSPIKIKVTAQEIDSKQKKETIELEGTVDKERMKGFDHVRIITQDKESKTLESIINQSDATIKRGGDLDNKINNAIQATLDIINQRKKMIKRSEDLDNATQDKESKTLKPIANQSDMTIKRGGDLDNKINNAIQATLDIVNQRKKMIKRSEDLDNATQDKGSKTLKPIANQSDMTIKRGGDLDNATQDKEFKTLKPIANQSDKMIKRGGDLDKTTNNTIQATLDRAEVAMNPKERTIK